MEPITTENGKPRPENETSVQSDDPLFKAPLNPTSVNSPFKRPSLPSIMPARPKPHLSTTKVSKNTAPETSPTGPKPPNSNDGGVGRSTDSDKPTNQPGKSTDSDKPTNKPSASSENATPAAVQPIPSCTAPAPYQAPAWADAAPRHYSLEVLRSGQIVDTLELAGRASLLFGRLPDCDVTLEHPSISRHHAALLYRASAEGDSQPAGWYLCDLGSTHGTKLNKTPIQPHVYCRVQVGHMCRLGGSSRLFILQGPQDDMESESDLTVTEMKARGGVRRQKIQRLEEGSDDSHEPEPDKVPVGDGRAAGDEGISWGIAEDADEDADLQFNPFALGETEGEQLYLVDPKKTLRGWFEREGHELIYHTQDLPGARFNCKIELPVDGADGRPVMVEYQHLGKKKEAVFQCALEACRVLDRAGLLRQAKHESHKKRKRPSGYGSDEDDAFLDRTGDVEVRRRRRREAAGKAVTAPADTYQSLLAQYESVRAEATELEARLVEAPRDTPSGGIAAADEGDELDAFMTRLSRGDVQDRAERRRLKARLTQLRTEELRLCKLVNLSRPASLPPLKPPAQAAAARAPLTGFIGKRKGSARFSSAASTLAKPAASLTRPAPNRTPAEVTGSDPSPAGQTPLCRQSADQRLPSPSADDEAGADVPRPRKVPLGSDRGPSLGSQRGPQGPDRGSLGPERDTLGADRGPLEPERDPLGPDSGPLGPERGPLGPDRGPFGPERDPLGPDRGSLGPDRGPLGPDGGPLRPESPPQSPLRKKKGHRDSVDERVAGGDSVEERVAGGDSVEKRVAGGESVGVIDDVPPSESRVVDRLTIPTDQRTHTRHSRERSDAAEESAITAEAPPKKARRRGKAHKSDKESDYAALAGDGRYDVWVPPAGQTGDGRTSLNDKLGY